MTQTDWLVLGAAAIAVLAFHGTGTAIDAYVLAEAIGYVESRGNYGALGPDTSQGRALGKYQILPSNIGPWSQDILGYPVSAADFLASPSLQDTIARGKIAALLTQYSPADVASIWFSGRPLAQAGNAADVTGTTVPAYVQAVLDRLPHA